MLLKTQLCPAEVLLDVVLLLSYLLSQPAQPDQPGCCCPRLRCDIELAWSSLHLRHTGSGTAGSWRAGIVTCWPFRGLDYVLLCEWLCLWCLLWCKDLGGDSWCWSWLWCFHQRVRGLVARVSGLWAGCVLLPGYHGSHSVALNTTLQHYIVSVAVMFQM